MAFSDADGYELLGHLFRSARDVSPSLHDLLETYFDSARGPVENLEQCVLAMIQNVRLQSRGGYQDALDRLQRFVEAENGTAIDEVVVTLTPQEEQLYETTALRFSDSDDMAECLHELMGALEGIRSQQ